MPEKALLVTAPTGLVALGVALIDAGILAPSGSGFNAIQPNLCSVLPSSPSGAAHAFVVVVANDQPTLDAVLARIPLDMQNRVDAPLTMVAGGILPRAPSWPVYAVEAGLLKMNRKADWDAAIAALVSNVAATDAEKAVGIRFQRDPAVTMDESWFNKIVNQMKTTLGWTNAQKNTFIANLQQAASNAL